MSCRIRQTGRFRVSAMLNRDDDDDDNDAIF